MRVSNINTALWSIHSALSGDALLSVVGRATGLMETRDPGYRVNRRREAFCPIIVQPGGLLLPGKINLAPGPATLPTNLVGRLIADV